jgi:hypothetical protein
MNQLLRSISFSGLMHKRITLGIVLLMMIGESWGQVATDGLNNSTTLFTLTNGAYYTGNSAVGEGPSNSPFASEGSHSRGVSNNSATLVSGDINTTSYTGIALSFRLASFSLVTATNGADAADIVTVEISPDGGTTYYSTLRVLGNSNAYWAYSATGLATTPYDGNITPVNFQPGGGGSRTTDGYSTVSVTGLPAVLNLRIRITLLNDNSNERWVVDDFQITGTCTPLPSNPTGTITPAGNINPVCTSTTLSYSGASANIYWQTSATGTSTANSTTTDLTVTTSGTYYVRAFNGTCWSTSSLASSAIVVNTPLSITSQPANISVASPGIATFTVSASGTIAGYQWQVNDGSGWVNATSTPYSGGTTATLTVNPSTSSLDGYAFRCIISATSPCTDITSGIATLTVLEGPCVSDASGYTGWTLSGATSSASQACSGNGILFTANGQFAVTTSVTNPLLLNFNKKRSGDATAWSMDVQIGSTPTGPWTTVTTVSSITATCSPNTAIDLSAYTGLRYIRFLDTRASGTNQRGIDDITITCGTSCIPTHTITGFTPTSGSPGTIVTITGTGFTGATAVKFGSVSVTPTVIDNNTITVVVPANAVSNKISVTVGGCDVISASNFTFLSQNANCGTGSFGTNGLIISEVFDSQVGTLSYVELFNPTNASISLSTYSLRIITDGPTNTDYSLGSASIPSGGVYVISIGDDTYPGSSVCGVTVNLAFPTGSGFNGNDRVILRRSGADLDVVNNPNYGSANNNSFKGFSQLRNQGVLNPTTSYNSAEWNNSSIESCSHLGTAPSSLSSSNVTITTQPSNVNCAVVTFSVIATSTPGTINYVWYYQSPGAASWSLVSSLNGTNGLVVTGSGTSSITVTGNTSILRDYQFYCEIGSGGSPQCIKYTNTVQYTYDSRLFYRTRASGQWTDVSIWEMSDTETGTYISACHYPVASNSNKVNIIGTHTVSIDNVTINIDWLNINNGGILNLNGTNGLSINNGNTAGADFEVNGTFADNAVTGVGNGLSFNASATWQLAANATIIKTATSSANVYRDNYQGGINSIPASANWFIRYLGIYDISVSTVGMFYPNLTIESNSGLWNPVSTGRFTGTTGGFATVKGNLDIGGTGSGTVTVYNENTNATAMQILGNLNVRSGSTLTNNGNASGTGFEVKGNVTVEGTLTSNGIAGNAGTLTLSGTAPQSISGAGAYNLYSLTVNNTGAIGEGSGVTLNRALSMDGVLTLTSGLINTKATNILSLTDNATCPSGGTDVAFVNGPMRKAGTAAFNFPVGKLVGSTGYYGMIGISAASSSCIFEALFYRANANLLGPLENPPLLRVSYCEYWDLNRIAGSENVFVTLSWTPKSPCNVSYINNTAGIVVANLDQTGAAIWRSLGVNALTGDPVAGGTITASAPPFTYFKFALGSTNIAEAPLPLVLNLFNAKPKQTAIQLDWVVGNNHQQQQYILERGANAQTFETITTVSAKQGTTAADYVYDDAKPLNGWNYYRLRAIGTDGKSNSSSIIKVWWGKGVTVNVLPNPATEKIVINLSEPSSIKEIQIVNAMGQVMRKITTVQFFNEFNISSMQAGIYYIRFLGENGLTTRSFVKQ